MDPTNDVISYLQINFESFTRSQKRIARFIIDNSQESTFYKVDKMAKMCEVNPSTVVRFFKNIGFDGFPHFQKTLQANLLKEINKLERQVNLRRPALAKLHQDDLSLPTLLSLNNDLKVLNHLNSTIEVDKIREFAKRLISARKRYLVAAKGSFGLGHLFSYGLSNVLPDTILLKDSDGAIYDNIIDFKPDDILVAINGPRYTSRTVKTAQYIHKKKICPIISITDSEQSPLFPISELCLFYPNLTTSYVRTLIGMHSIINCILVEVVAENREKAIERLEGFEDLFEYFNIVHK